MKYIVIERYADNGEFSHYDLINTENGETAITDIDETLQLRQCAVSGSNSTLYSQCCNENPILRKIDDVEYYECPYCKQKCEVEWQEDEFPDYCH